MGIVPAYRFPSVFITSTCIDDGLKSIRMRKPLYSPRHYPLSLPFRFRYSALETAARLDSGRPLTFLVLPSSAVARHSPLFPEPCILLPTRFPAADNPAISLHLTVSSLPTLFCAPAIVSPPVPLPKICVIFYSPPFEYRQSTSSLEDL